MKNKLNAQELRWILYDVGNSAFVLLITTIIPIFFNSLAENDGISSVNYLAYWGYTASIVTIIVAVIGPILGTISDHKGLKGPIFLISILIGCIGCVFLGFASNWMVFLLIFIVAKVGYSLSLIFYDSMLSDITTEDRMDEVSAKGYAWGYIGSCVPFVLCLAIALGYEKIGISFSLAMKIIFVINAIWWLGMSIPLLRNYKQIHYVERVKNVISNSFGRIGHTLKNVKKDKKVFLFLLAFFCYIDGVYTIIDMATAYGSAMGLDTTGLLLALLVTQIVAFPCAIIFGNLSSRYEGSKLIKICILAYLCIAIFAVFLRYQWQFWMLAIFVGMFQGGIQALSRSYYTKIIPKEQSGEYFALMDICGKGASFIGTALVGAVAQITGSINIGVSSLVVMFALGLIFMFNAEKE
ncbi:MAG: MFS transporter [Eubacteriales bacterium]|nr:MFS transporter [Eubacteriales bacterium]